MVQQENTVTLGRANTVISAVGYRSENSLYEAVKGMNREIYNVGDSSQVHNNYVCSLERLWGGKKHLTGGEVKWRNSMSI